MVSHKAVLSRKVVLSWQALFRVPQVVSLRTSGGCGHRRNLGTVRVKENNDDDKRTRKERSKTIDQTQDRSRL